MPLSVPYPDPTAANVTLPTTYVYATKINIDARTGTGLIEFEVYRDANAANAYVHRLGVFSFPLSPNGSPAQVGPAPIVTPAVPAVPGTPPVYQLDGDNNPVLDSDGNPIVVTLGTPGTPEQPAVYGPNPVIRPAIPPFAEVVGPFLTGQGGGTPYQAIYIFGLAMIPGSVLIS